MPKSVQIGAERRNLQPFSLEKGLRVADAIATVAVRSNSAMQSLQAWVQTLADPSNLTRREKLTHVVPLVWAQARRELTDLLALAMLDNEALEQADRTGNVETLVADMSLELRHRASFKQGIEAIVTLCEHIVAEVGWDELGEAWTARLEALLPEDEDQPEDPSTEGAPSGSTGSPADTDGAAATS